MLPPAGARVQHVPQGSAGLRIRSKNGSEDLAEGGFHGSCNAGTCGAVDDGDALIWLVAPAPTLAQVSTATIQGTVTDATGVLPGATVTAREIQSGFTHEATSGADGSFTLAGLRPGRTRSPLPYPSTSPKREPSRSWSARRSALDFRITPDVVYTETVTVVGDTRLVDTRTSEVATNVTQEQMRYLPQNSRNFLNFAALAPGRARLRQRVPQGVLGRARCRRRTSTSSSTASATRTTSSTAASSARTRAAATRSRRTRCRSSRS